MHPYLPSCFYPIVWQSRLKYIEEKARMKFKLLFTALLLTASLSAYAEDKASTTEAVAESPIVVKEVSDDFDSIKENIEMAITGKGLLVSGTLHVSEMLNRTGKDLGFDKQIFEKAESVEFCSAVISHKMAVADPANISVCPFTIAVYTYTEKPETVYVSYHRPNLAGDAEEVTKDINDLMSSVVEEATE